MKAFILAVICCAAAGCALNADESDQKPKSTPPRLVTFACAQIEEVRWDTSGGGDLHFDVLKNANSTFTLTNIAYDFQKTHGDLVITVSDNLQLYILLDVLYSQEHKIWTETPTDKPTGSWTYIGLMDSCGNREKLYNAFYVHNGVKRYFRDIHEEVMILLGQ